jgi:hypothetical protein
MSIFLAERRLDELVVRMRREPATAALTAPMPGSEND